MSGKSHKFRFVLDGTKKNQDEKMASRATRPSAPSRLREEDNQGDQVAHGVHLVRGQKQEQDFQKMVASLDQNPLLISGHLPLQFRHIPIGCLEHFFYCHLF
jgi:hypothetical protein